MNDFSRPGHDLPHRRLLKRLESVAELGEADRQAVLDLPLVLKDLDSNQDVAQIGDRPSHCCLVVEGWTCRYKMLAEGGRQIMSFHIPGDIPDLQSLFLATMDHSIGTLTRTTIALVQHRDLRDLARRHEAVSVALWRYSLMDAASFREWMVGIGRRSAHERIAHLFCEMATRAASVGLNDGDSYPWPVTQVELADAIGLSDVHVNRVLRDLKDEGLLSLTRGSYRAIDLEGLKRVAQFDDTYLHVQA